MRTAAEGMQPRECSIAFCNEAVRQRAEVIGQLVIDDRATCPAIVQRDENVVRRDELISASVRPMRRPL